MNVLLIIILGLLGVGAVLVAFGTIVKNDWGINLAEVSCPRCGSSLPPRREPENAHQTLWGGATCGTCGAEVDKWGREVAATRGRSR